MGLWQKIYSKREALRLFIPLLLIYAASYFQRTALPGTIYDTVSTDLHIGAEQVAYISSAFVYAYSLPQLAIGMLIDRFCGSRVVVFGGLIFVAGALWMPFCTSLPLVYASRAVTGLGASTMYLSLVKETDRLFDRKNYALMIGIAYFIGMAAVCAANCLLRHCAVIIRGGTYCWEPGSSHCCFICFFSAAKPVSKCRRCRKHISLSPR
jgi:MFS family permease